MIRLRVLACAATMSLALAAAAQQSEMRLDRVRESLTGTHRHYQQYIDGIEVVGAERSETLLREGAVRVDFDRTARVRGGRITASSVPTSPSDLVYVNASGEARLARRVIVETRRLEPHAKYFDASTGELLRDDPLFFTAKQGRVFDVNPVAKLNDPTLRDQNGSATAVPDGAYSEVDLPDLNPTGPLTGPNVQIVDIAAPFTPRADASQSLDFNRSQPQFQEVNAYFQIDRAQRYLQSLGYTGARQLVAYSIPVDAHGDSGDNSYFVEGTPPDRGTLYFGDGGTEDAEDSDIMLHEFGHAIHNWIIPGALTGTASSQAAALAEGFGDYWSFSSTYALTIPSGRDPFCIGDWDARCYGDDPSKECGYPVGADCLRRVDSSKTMADYINSESAGTQHLNGEIWSSALREIFMTLVHRNGIDAAKPITDTIVLESLFGVPPSPDFRTVAQSMVAADRQLRGGSDVDVICSAMMSRGIFGAGDCGNTPRGEWTLFQSPDQQMAIPDGTGSITSTITVGDTRAIAKLAVRVDIAHSSRGDLVITLVGPNGTSVKLKGSSETDRTPDVHATFGLDAPAVDSLDAFSGQPANGVWKLVVSDIYAGDTGVLQSWSLLIDFAGDAAMTVRPTTTASRIIIPVVGHAIGASGTRYTSDVYLLNRGSRDTTAMLIFTPSGVDGKTNFAAVKATIAPGQTTLFRDIVASTFGSTGLGSLEIQGDTTNLLAWSEAIDETDGMAQSIEAVSSSDAAAEGDPARYILIPPLDNRLNVGVVEVGGSPGVVHVQVFWGLAPTSSSGFDVAVTPYGHAQISNGGNFTIDVPGHAWVAAVSVSGGARVVSYGSIIDNHSGNAIFERAAVAAQSPADVVIPVVGHTSGVAGVRWSSTVEYANVNTDEAAAVVFFPGESETDLPQDAWVGVPGGIGSAEVQLPPGGVVTSHFFGDEPVTPYRRIGSRVGAYPKSQAIAFGGSADALHVESTADYRSNYGVTEVDGVPANVRVTLFDSAGRSIASTEVVVGGHEVQQLPISALYGGTVTNGRLHFEVISGGRVFGYVSVLNNANNDSVFELAR